MVDFSLDNFKFEVESFLTENEVPFVPDTDLELTNYGRPKPDVELSEEQNQAIEFVLENLGKGTIALAGPAGSGKTTLIKELAYRINGPVAISAMTNKARAVLQNKGIEDAVTLHQACLRPKFKPPLDSLDIFYYDCRACDRLLEFSSVPCPHKQCLCNCDDECPVHGPRIAENIAKKLNTSIDKVAASYGIFRENGIYMAMRSLGILDVFKYLETWKPAPAQDGVLIVDEASMLGGEELEKAEQVYSKIVLVGDEFQLPPVKSKPVFWQVPIRIALQHIHRQAKGSQPLELAEGIRKGSITKINRPEPVNVQKIDIELCRQGMPIIVWRNETRLNVTKIVRKKLGYEGLGPQVGEYLICCNGNDRVAKARGLFNNSLWKVKAVIGQRFDLENDAGEVLVNEPVFMEELGFGYGVPFRFAYALTCHKAQGSEWPKVMIHRRDAFAYQMRAAKELPSWLYTAVTRAKEQVIWVGDD